MITLPTKEACKLIRTAETDTEFTEEWTPCALFQYKQKDQRQHRERLSARSRLPEITRRQSLRRLLKMKEYH